MKDHLPVMLEEVLKMLNLREGSLYLDCTFGAGGYSRGILESNNSKLISLDQDPYTKKYADELTTKYGSRFDFINDNFRNIKNIFKAKEKFDGVVYDIGVSSMQLDQKDRGFSFQGSNILDMRMSSKGISAYDVVNEMDEESLANIIYLYGDERNSRRIAKNIVEKRKIKLIETTAELAEIVSSSFSYRGKIHPATKTFQAIRIAVNDEIESLRESLKALPAILNDKARVAVVTFHSLEDRIVKEYFKENSQQKIAISKYKENEIETDKPFRLITNKAVKPSRAEVLSNPRSRSAKLRVVEKIGGKDET